MGDFLSPDEVDQLLRGDVGPRFTTYTIIKKLDGAGSTLVSSISNLIDVVCDDLGLKLNPEGNYLHYDTLVFAVGGDGTMLEAMRRASIRNAAVIGINLGRVGFLTDINVMELDRTTIGSFIKQVIESKESTITERMLLRNNMRNDVLAMNEFTVSACRPDGMIEYSLWIDDYHAGIHRANSVIVSTPTGSTAYSLSAGGALMMPELEAIQITPVAAMSMTSRPIVVPAKSKVAIQVHQKAVLNCDGQRVAEYDACEPGPVRFEFQAALNKARVLHNEGWNFFNVLTKKLGWNHK